MLTSLVNTYLYGTVAAAIWWLVMVEYDEMKYGNYQVKGREKLTLTGFCTFLSVIFLWPLWVLVCLLCLAIYGYIKLVEPDFGEEY